VTNWNIKNTRVVCAFSCGGFLFSLGRSGKGLETCSLILPVVVVGSGRRAREPVGMREGGGFVGWLTLQRGVNGWLLQRHYVVDVVGLLNVLKVGHLSGVREC